MGLYVESINFFCCNFNCYDKLKQKAIGCVVILLTSIPNIEELNYPFCLSQIRYEEYTPAYLESQSLPDLFQ